MKHGKLVLAKMLLANLKSKTIFLTKSLNLWLFLEHVFKIIKTFQIKVQEILFQFEKMTFYNNKRLIT